MAPPSPFERWFAARIDLVPGYLESAPALHRDWLAWCGREKVMPSLPSLFFERLREAAGTAGRDPDWVRGVRLKPQLPPQAEVTVRAGERAEGAGS